MTSTRAKYLIHILDKIGAPLLVGINAVDGAADAAKTAQTMASLLAKTVELSIALGNAADLHDGTEDDSLRVALAALSGPIIAQRYTRDKKIPDDGAIKQMIAGLESTLTFSENFTPSVKTNDTVAATEDGTPAKTAAAPINYLYYLKAVLPVIEAVDAFSFGQNPQKLIADIGLRLTKHAENLRATLFTAPLSDEEKKSSDLVCLRAVADLYATCHAAETTRLAATDNAADTGSIDAVWTAFDEKLSLLQVMTTAILNPDTVAQESAPAPVKADSAPPQEAVKTEPTQTPEPAAQPAPKAKTSKPAAGPMGFFAKKDDAEDKEDFSPVITTTAPEEAEPVVPPPQATPETPPEQSPDTNTSDAAPTTPATEDPPKDKKSAGSPMSFFKAPSDDDDDDA